MRNASRETATGLRLAELPQANDFDGMRAMFHASCACIPHESYTSNDVPAALSSNREHPAQDLLGPRPPG